jgi:hypothetical protein
VLRCGGVQCDAWCLVVDCSELVLNYIYLFPLQYFEDEGVVDFKRGVRDSAEFGTSRSQQLG